MDIKDIKVGQRWLLKSKKECQKVFVSFISDRTAFCGKEQEIVNVINEDGGTIFYIKGCDFYWHEDCLDRMVSDVPEAKKEVAPPPCHPHVEIPINMAITPEHTVRIGELWWLKKWDEIPHQAQMVMTDDMMPFLGSIQRITFISDDGFEIFGDDSGPDGEKFHFPYECLLEKVTDAAPIGAEPENTHTPCDRGVPIRKLSGIYEVQSYDGAATVRLVVDYANGTFRIESKAKDGKFLFDTKQQGDPDLWESVLEAIRTAVSYGKKVVSDAGE